MAVTLGGVTIRRVLVDPGLDLDLDPPPSGAEVAAAGPILDLAGFGPHEVLVVATDPELLAEAGRLGAQRLIASDDRSATAGSVAELVELLERPAPS